MGRAGAFEAVFEERGIRVTQRSSLAAVSRKLEANVRMTVQIIWSLSRRSILGIAHYHTTGEELERSYRISCFHDIGWSR